MSEQSSAASSYQCWDGSYREREIVLNPIQGALISRLPRVSATELAMVHRLTVPPAVETLNEIINGAA